MVGPNTHTFSTNFVWDGVSNVIVQTSYSNGNVGRSTDNVQMYYSTPGFASTTYYIDDGETPATILAGTSGSVTSEQAKHDLRVYAILFKRPIACNGNYYPGPDCCVMYYQLQDQLQTRRQILSQFVQIVQNLLCQVVLLRKTAVLPFLRLLLNLAINDAVSGVPSNLTNGLPVTMPLGATIDSIRVKVNLTHTYDGDLNIHLRSPNAQVVNLINQRGGTGENMVNTQISSNTANVSMASGTPPYTNALFRADLATLTTTVPATTTNTFSNLFVPGTGAAETWTISVHDMFGADMGIFQDWSITIFYQEIIPVPYLWSTTTPNTVYTNSGLSSPYTNQNINTVFVKPTADTNYIIAATLGSCTKRDTVHVKVFNISAAPTA